jgi:hypothetical protein
MVKSLCFILLLALSTTPACSRFTAGGRQERAYAKYRNKLKLNRERRVAQSHRAGPKTTPPSEIMTPSERRAEMEKSDSPQAVPSNLNGE